MRGAGFVAAAGVGRVGAPRRGGVCGVGSVGWVGSVRAAGRRAARMPVVAQAGGPLVLTEENVESVLSMAKDELGAVFGNSAENRGVGITGDVALAGIDGPVVTLRLSGRFWHKRADVLARVSAFVCERIPEICDVEIEDVAQLDDTLVDDE